MAAPIAAAVKQERELGNEAEKVNVTFGQKLQKLSLIERSIFRMVRGFGLVIAAAVGLEKVIETLWRRFEGGDIAASNFLASINAGGPDAAKTIAGIQQELDKLNKELAEIPQRSIYDQVFGRSERQIREEQQQLADSLAWATKQKQVADEDARVKKLRATEQEHRDQLKLRRLEEATSERDRLLEEGLSPLEKAQKNLDDAMKTATGVRGVNDDLADEIEKAAKEGFKRAKKEIQETVAEAIRNGFNQAMKDQVDQFGIQSATTLLSQINIKMDGIHRALPRR